MLSTTVLCCRNVAGHAWCLPLTRVVCCCSWKLKREEQKQTNRLHVHAQTLLYFQFAFFGCCATSQFRVCSFTDPNGDAGDPLVAGVIRTAHLRNQHSNRVFGKAEMPRHSDIHISKGNCPTLARDTADQFPAQTPRHHGFVVATFGVSSQLNYIVALICVR